MVMLPSARIVFAGGGTGGHLYPAIAIANRISELTMKRMKVEIIFVGTKRGLEYRLRDSLGYPLHIINIRGLVRTFTLKNLLIPFVVIGALVKSFLLLKRFKPDIVVGTGGYVSWPVLRVAAFKKIPTVLQEQNSYPGITTRQLAPGAEKIYLGFEKGRQYLKTSGEVIVTGNPVRSFISLGDRDEAVKHFDLDNDKKTILVLGGSQGARAINEAVMNGLEKNGVPDGYQILWQMGKRGYKEVTDKVGSKVAPGCTLFPFADRMDLVYAAADLVIARAGALTLAELAACQLPSILIPYPFAAGEHQRHNAGDYVRQGASIMIEEKELGGIDLIEKTRAVMESDKFRSMKEALRKMTEGKKPAVDIIAEDIIDIISSGKDAFKFET